MSESRAAAQGGVTTDITYIRTGQYYLNRGGPYAEFFPEVLARSEGRAYVDYGFHVLPMQRSHIDEIGDPVDRFGGAVLWSIRRRGSAARREWSRARDARFTDELATDPNRRALMARVNVSGDPHCDRIFPNEFPTVLTVRTHSGGRLEARVLSNRGGPCPPLTDDELRTKFRDNVAEVLTADLADDIERAAAAFPGNARAHDLLTPLADLDIVKATG